MLRAKADNFLNCSILSLEAGYGSKVYENAGSESVQKSVFRIRIHLIRIRIRHFRLNNNPEPRLWWPKILKKFQMEKKILFWIKNYNLPIPRPPKKLPSYRRSLQPSKENIQHFKTWNFNNFFLLLWVIFALLDSGSTDLVESGSNPIRNSRNPNRMTPSHSLPVPRRCGYHPRWDGRWPACRHCPCPAPPPASSQQKNILTSLNFLFQSGSVRFWASWIRIH